MQCGCNLRLIIININNDELTLLISFIKIPLLCLSIKRFEIFNFSSLHKRVINLDVTSKYTVNVQVLWLIISI